MARGLTKKQAYRTQYNILKAIAWALYEQGIESVYAKLTLTVKLNGHATVKDAWYFTTHGNMSNGGSVVSTYLRLFFHDGTNKVYAWGTLREGEAVLFGDASIRDARYARAQVFGQNAVNYANQGYVAWAAGQAKLAAHLYNRADVAALRLA